MQLLIVDGYNCLWRLQGRRPRDLEAGRASLATRLRALASRDRSVLIIWDARRGPPGLPREAYVGPVAMRFAPSADAAIVEAVRADPDPGSVCVVSDDGDVTRPVRQLGAQVWTVAELAARLEGGGRRAPRRAARGADDPEDAKPPSPSSAAEVEDWLRYFGAAPESGQGDHDHDGR